MSRNIAILSYGTGNLASLSSAIEAAGATCSVAFSGADLSGADALVLPGVGHFGHAMRYFRSSGLLEPTMEMMRNGTPTLGICLGFQLLTQASEEAAEEDGLGLLPCTTERIRPSAPHVHKVPHLGWNKIHQTHGTPRLLANIPSDEQIFYFANAYGVNGNSVLSLPHATYSHGSEYVALIEQDSIFGVQFHPEKSRSQGLQLLKNFLTV